MTIHTTKYQQAILYLCWKLGKEIRGKKKLAKLLYYADFDFFEKNQRHFTGETYKALPMGPFPSHLEEITRAMIKARSLSVNTISEREGYIPTEVYRAEHEPNLDVFSPEEKEILDLVIKKYGHLNGKQLEDLTHAEAPYVSTKLKDTIPYEMAFYRGTDFSDAA